MSNKCAIITGASRGIGAEVANYFAHKQYDLVLISKNEPRLAKIKNQLLQINPTISISSYCVDLSNTQLADKTAQKILAEQNKIDVLFNGAGIAIGGTSELSIDDFFQQIRVNVMSMFAFIKSVTVRMKEQKSGYIFNMSSLVGKRALPSNGGYCASKSAVIGLSQALFFELLPYNIKVTVLCPGTVDTDMTKKLDMPCENKIPTSDIALTLDYLLSLSSVAAIENIDIQCVNRLL
jgi:short-subunit dehydrogenase